MISTRISFFKNQKMMMVKISDITIAALKGHENWIKLRDELLILKTKVFSNIVPLILDLVIKMITPTFGNGSHLVF